MITHNGPTVGSVADTAAAVHGFRYIVDWPTITGNDGAAIRAFWRREGALTDDALMDQRLTQVVLHACTQSGEIAGVCTAVPMTLPSLGQPMYYWRTFIGRAWRATPLVRAMLQRSCAHLEKFARARDFPCIGVLLELENARFRERCRMATWWNPRFVYIGRSERGLDLRVRYFKGARLKAVPTP